MRAYNKGLRQNLQRGPGWAELLVRGTGAKSPEFLANVNSRSRSLFAVARPSVCLSSATFVRPTQAVEILRNISMALGTLAIH